MFEIKVTLDATPTLASLLEALAEAFRPTPLEDARTAPNTEPEAAQSAPEPDPPAKIPSIDVTENYRVDVRKVLAKLNRSTGKNIASDLIRSHGVSKLTEVPLAELPALMQQAEEALHAK